MPLGTTATGTAKNMTSNLLVLTQSHHYSSVRASSSAELNIGFTKKQQDDQTIKTTLTARH